ncbi:MAG TPA: radical SAM protein, partial [Thermoplasmata archaeon]|nr:radical SAM protein [Thermoplasmata archaeon]
MPIPPLTMLPMASSHRGALSKACTQCSEGKKMVLFVSGLCRFRCFYCPVSERRNQHDETYANERLVRTDEDVLDEARSIGAEGTGITGGDPLGVFDRTLHYVELLKRTFGPSHHIHLYTHEPNQAKLERLARAGLDEFRLHIPHYLWGPLTSDGRSYREVLERAPSWGIRRGVEIPVLPEKEAELARLLKALDGIGVDFVNLNELEFSETNEAKLYDRSYTLDPRGGWGVRGSREVAERVVRSSRLSVPVHYCSSRFKDGVQLKQRLLRRIERTAPPFAESTGEGTILLGIVEAQEGEDLARVGRRTARLG